MTPDARALLARARALRTAPPTEPVPSPCIAVCRIHLDRAVCEGCLRTLDEIAAWSRLPEDGKREVWLRIEQRAQQQESA